MDEMGGFDDGWDGWMDGWIGWIEGWRDRMDDLNGCV